MVLYKKSVVFLLFACFITTFVFAHEWMAPKEDADVKNPIVHDEQSLFLGKTVYSEFCINCHGFDTMGLDPETIGLKKSPSNLQETLKTHSDGDIFWKIKTGRMEMPSFKEDLEEKEIWSVIHYIRSL